MATSGLAGAANIFVVPKYLMARNMHSESAQWCLGIISQVPKRTCKSLEVACRIRTSVLDAVTSHVEFVGEAVLAPVRIKCNADAPRASESICFQDGRPG